MELYFSIGALVNGMILLTCGCLQDVYIVIYLRVEKNLL